jgi:hypothetical protein
MIELARSQRRKLLKHLDLYVRRPALHMSEGIPLKTQEVAGI